MSTLLLCVVLYHVGGGYDEGTVPGKLFSIIDIDCSDYSYCFGVIGNGSAFCIRKNCPVKIHASVKVTFCGNPESFVFIRRAIPGTVFCEPRLTSSKVPSEVMSDWPNRSLTISDWVLEFQAIDGTHDTPMSVEESQIEKEFILESSIMRTPAKRKKDSLGDDYEGLRPTWKNQKYQRTLPEDPEELESFISEGVKKGVITSAVSRIETYIDGMSGVVTDLSTVHHERLVNLEDDLEAMIATVQTIKARVGVSLDLGERYTAPTLWGSAAFMAEDLAKALSDFDELQQGIVVPFQNSLNELSDTDLELTTKTDKIVKAVKLLLTRVQIVNKSVQEVKADLVLVRAEQGIRFSYSGGPSGERLPEDELMDFILSEGAEPSTPPRGGPTGTTTSPVVVSPPSSPDGSDSFPKKPSNPSCRS